MTVFLTDYTSQGFDGYARVQSSAMAPYNQNQHLASTASSAQFTNAISNQSSLIRIHNDATNPINFEIGTNPTAVAGSSPRMAANQTEYFCVPLNSGFKVAIITTT